jgi:(1->4)-alpha-D-glucan 1-alpha-D-glucosylmutase
MLSRLQKEVGRNDRSLFPLARQLARDPRDPRLKLFVTWRALRFRRQHPDLFLTGDYVPLDVEGRQAMHLCAFARKCRSSSGPEPKIAIVIAPRMLAQLTPLPADSATAPPPLDAAVWEDTQIIVENMASFPLRNVFTGQTGSSTNFRLPVADALADFPVALLTNLPSNSHEA